MPTLETVNLSYSQTLFRLLAYVGEVVVVSVTAAGDHASGPVLIGRLLRADPLDLRAQGEDGEAVYVSLESGSGFVLARPAFVEGEVIDGPVLRIVTAGLTYWISFAEVEP
ncbi:MAG TPA: hypothetical protein VFN18_01305 [Solirubrobacterales bacterium]|nr:hypothetical protein [Solirubrobacterales bacterium]